MDEWKDEPFSSFIKANLEMNKERFAAELVCLLEVDSRVQDVADIKADDIESFFIVGAECIAFFSSVARMHSVLLVRRQLT